ncbi:MAG: ribosome maturation factor [Sphingobacteriales bacterium]|nr:ribosome maturation factor [Sphingobacteriales bacterium]
MNPEPQIEVIKNKVEALIASEPDLFLVEVKIKPTNNIRVFIDGDNGVSIDKLVSYNRRLYRQIEEEGMFPGGDFSLEISSPGLDEPLKLHRQYIKNIGRPVEAIRKDGIKTEGKLLSVTEKEITIEEQKGKGKKLELIIHTIPFENIKAIKIQIKF